MSDDTFTDALETALGLRRHLIEALSFDVRQDLAARIKAVLSASQRLVDVAAASQHDQAVWIEQDIDRIHDQIAQADSDAGMTERAGEMALRTLDAIFELIARDAPDRRTDLVSLVTREVACFDDRIAQWGPA